MASAVHQQGETQDRPHPHYKVRDGDPEPASFAASWAKFLKLAGARGPNSGLAFPPVFLRSGRKNVRDCAPDKMRGLYPTALVFSLAHLGHPERILDTPFLGSPQTGLTIMSHATITARPVAAHPDTKISGRYAGRSDLLQHFGFSPCIPARFFGDTVSDVSQQFAVPVGAEIVVALRRAKPWNRGTQSV